MFAIHRVLPWSVLICKNCRNVFGHGQGGETTEQPLEVSYVIRLTFDRHAFQDGWRMSVKMPTNLTNIDIHCMRF